jgi:hypothetical protein
MNILDALKRRHEEQKSPDKPLIEKRKQTNTPLTYRIIGQLEKLKAEFAVPRYAIIEHVVETGIFYTFRTLKRPKKKELLREHLIDKHMLDCGYDDPEELLRLGEGRYAFELITLARIVRRDFMMFGRAVAEAKRAKNFDIAEKVQQQLLGSCVIFADWLSKHSLDETGDARDEESDQ